MSLTGSKVYTVRGSEDGIIGVYSNMTKAYNSAKKYVSAGGTKKCEPNNLHDCRKNLNKFGWYEIIEKDDEAVSAEILSHHIDE